MKDDFLRVSAHTPALRLGDCRYNAQQIVDAVCSDTADTALFVFPELCLTGYTCGDLFLQSALLRGAEEALGFVLRQTAEISAVIVVGLPVRVGSSLYNCAAVCCAGRLLGLVPKRHLTSAESRWFVAGEGVSREIDFAGQATLLCADSVFTCTSMPSFVLGVEICQALWEAHQPSIRLAQAGATVIANLSASHELVGKKALRRSLMEVQSARLHCAYVLANAGEGESGADYVFAGGSMIAENGKMIAETPLYTVGCATADIDLQHLLYDRCKAGFEQAVASQIGFDLQVKDLQLQRAVNASPFVPQEVAACNERCEEVLQLQTAGLARRLSHTGSEAVVGLSGGLDSALALLVIARAYEKLGRDPAGITTVTMPCFGTTGRTYRNACALAKACGATLREVNIADAVNQHFKDISHSGAYDVTYENAQARERTQVLMDIANQSGALVIGTGDLSELVLGWATYNGDHMSMYGVNGSIPKTLVRALVGYEAERTQNAELKAVLGDVLDTPVSPELLPPENGDIAQKTEQIVGNYDLHDFFLYHMLRYGSAPSRIYRLACVAFEGRFTPSEIKQWLCVFLKRFFTQQFKRNCLPDGAKVGTVGVSPRGDWQMPSDATAALWLREAENL